MLMNFWKEEQGAIISAELILVLTVATLAMVVGLSQVATAVSGELDDLAAALGALDQSYKVGGHEGCCATTSGSNWCDAEDKCDCTALVSCNKNDLQTSHGCEGGD